MIVENLSAYRNYRVLGIKCGWVEWVIESMDVAHMFGVYCLIMFVPGLAVWAITGRYSDLWLVAFSVGVGVIVGALLLLVWTKFIHRRYQKVVDVMNALEG